MTSTWTSDQKIQLFWVGVGLLVLFIGVLLITFYWYDKHSNQTKVIEYRLMQKIESLEEIVSENKLQIEAAKADMIKRVAELESKTFQHTLDAKKLKTTKWITATFRNKKKNLN